jgi:hypothetical protein
VCASSARTGLCGGQQVTAVPTATVGRIAPNLCTTLGSRQLIRTQEGRLTEGENAELRSAPAGVNPLHVKVAWPFPSAPLTRPTLIDPPNYCGTPSKPPGVGL